MTVNEKSSDLESGKAESLSGSPVVDVLPSKEVAEVTADGVALQPGLLARLRHYELALDRKLGVESQGPERVLPDQKKPPHTWAMFAIWASSTMNLSCFATGFLGPEFGLNFQQSVLCTVFGTFLGAAMTGWCATMGPATGLRQVSISRYSFGWYPSKIIAALNVIANAGWASVACITGGLALSAASDGSVSLVLGVIILAVVGMVISFVGLRGVFLYEQWAWLVFLVLFTVMYAEVGHHTDTSTASELKGKDLSGTVLTLLSIVFGSSASWASIVSDYYVHYPVNMSRTKVFLMTTGGIGLPTMFGMILGCVVGSALPNIPTWEAADANGIGYLIQVMLYPRGFAKFVLVLLILSGIGTSCVSMYSVALSIQQFARSFQLIPRFMWTLIVFVVVLLLGLAGRDHLLDWLNNFLPLLGYWATSFFVIVFSEHYFFRGHSIDNYDLDAWNDQSRLPIGIAGLISFLLGCVGWILGMSQTWYVGVIARKIGTYGGDLGNELSFVFTLSYIPIRSWELKKFGR